MPMVCSRLLPPKLLPELTRDSILRRVKEEVASDMPPKVIHDAFVELTPAQRETYERAERDGIIQLNSKGDTLTVQHVFELIMRLKQICNFDPLTGESAKLDFLLGDMEEVAANNRKAIIFSQWVEPLERLAASGELVAFHHDGFWQPMDTLRDKQFLEQLWQEGAPWKSW